jgi:YhgE/Pip-like protein
MKRWIPFTTICLVLCFLLGARTGSETEVARSQAKDEVMVTTQTTIAVVNTDTGVFVDGANINYSAAIIDTLGDDFIQVSPAMAESGFANGAYGAIITFPADVSEKVVSINDQHPEKVRVDFKVNMNLSDRDYVNTYVKIVSLEMSVNTTLAGTYVNSIFSQVHLAQDQVNRILKNDQSDLSALKTLTLVDFNTEVAWDESPELELEPTPADTSALYTQVSTFAKTVSSLYLDSYSEASNKYLEMRVGIYGLVDDFSQQKDIWLSELSNWSVGSLDYGQQLEEFANDVQNKENELDAWYKEILDWKSDIESYKSGINTWYQTMQTWFGATEDWYADYQQYLMDLGAYSNEIETYRSALINEIQPLESDMNDWSAQLGEYANELSGSYSSFTDFDLDSTDYRGQLSIYLQSLEAWHIELSDYYANLEIWSQELGLHQADLETAANTVMTTKLNIESLPSMPDSDDFLYQNDPSQYQIDVNEWLLALQTFAVSIPQPSTLAPIPEPPAVPQQFTGTIPQPISLPTWVRPSPPTYTGTQLPDMSLTVPSPTSTLPTLPQLVLPSVHDSTAPTSVADFSYVSVPAPGAPQISAPPAPDDIWTSLESMRDQLGSFDVEGYLTEDTKQEVALALAGYEGNLAAAREDLASQFQGNVLKMLDARSTYDAYVSVLRSQAMETHATEQDRLRATLDEYELVKTRNSEDTQSRMGHFANLMLESRSSAGLNQDLVGFTVNPVQFSAPELKPEDVPVTHVPMTGTYEGYLWITIWVLAGLLLITLASYVWTFHRRKRVDHA